MAHEEQVQSVVDHFGPNAFLVQTLTSLILGGITATYETQTAFEAAIVNNRAAGKDFYIRARILDTKRILEYFPDTREIYWTASQMKYTI